MAFILLRRYSFSFDCRRRDMKDLLDALDSLVIGIIGEDIWDDGKSDCRAWIDGLDRWRCENFIGLGLGPDSRLHFVANFES